MSYKKHNTWLKRQKVWTDEKIDWLIKSKDIYDDREDILNAFNDYFKTNVTLKRLRNISTKYKLSLPKANNAINNARENIKLGWVIQRGFTEKNIGDEIINGQKNQTFIKISNSKLNKEKYVLKQRYLYEKYHNIKLSKNECVIFLNGNNKDFSKENLYKITRGINCEMSMNKLYTKDNYKTLGRIKCFEWKEKIIELKKGKRDEESKI